MAERSCRSLNKSVKIITLGTSHGDPTVERFNCSTLLDIPDYGGILIDAGTPVLGLLIRKNYPLENLRAVFITHMHQDHFGGLPDILKYWVKRLPADRKLKIFLPENDCRQLLSVCKKADLMLWWKRITAQQRKSGHDEKVCGNIDCRDNDVCFFLSAA